MCFKKWFYIYFFTLITFKRTISKEIFEITTLLDDQKLRFIFHQFRNLTFNTIGKVSYKTKGNFLQEKFPNNARFPCNIERGKSVKIPKSVHRLKPGGNYCMNSNFK